MFTTLGLVVFTEFVSGRRAAVVSCWLPRYLHSTPKKLSNKATLSLCLLLKCSFTISKLRFFELRKPKISSCYTTS